MERKKSAFTLSGYKSISFAVATYCLIAPFKAVSTSISRRFINRMNDSVIGAGMNS